MIEFPKTIRPAHFDEVPMNSPIYERLKMMDDAKIIEGYSFKLKESDDELQKNIPFKFYAEININNSRLWDLILALTDLFPDLTSLIIGDSDSEPYYCDYGAKNDLIEKLNIFKSELTTDAFLEWGIIYNDNAILTELFVPESKYIKFWGVDMEGFRAIMNQFDLKQIDDLEFIDEYPKVRIPLKLVDDSKLDTDELINELKNF